MSVQVKTEASRSFSDMKVMAFVQRTLASSKPLKRSLGMFMADLFCVAIGRKADAGAATSLNCAVNPDLNSQQHFYYDSCRPKDPNPEAR